MGAGKLSLGRMQLVEKTTTTATIRMYIYAFLVCNVSEAWEHVEHIMLQIPKCCGHFVMAFANKTDARVCVDSTQTVYK